jgi:hypothetical protein
MGKLVGRAAASVVVLGAAFAVPAVAAAEPPETDTVTGHATETIIDVGANCDGAGLFEIVIDYNFVEHSTISAEGEHFTFTTTGTFVATPLGPVGEPASGHFTQWGGFNQTPGGAVNGTFTFNVSGRTDDGDRIRLHITDHFNVRPNGLENSFSLCKDASD